MHVCPGLSPQYAFALPTAIGALSLEFYSFSLKNKHFRRNPRITEFIIGTICFLFVRILIIDLVIFFACN